MADNSLKLGFGLLIFTGLLAFTDGPAAGRLLSYTTTDNRLVNPAWIPPGEDQQLIEQRLRPDYGRRRRKREYA